MNDSANNAMNFNPLIEQHAREDARNAAYWAKHPLREGEDTFGNSSVAKVSSRGGSSTPVNWNVNPAVKGVDDSRRDRFQWRNGNVPAFDRYSASTVEAIARQRREYSTEERRRGAIHKAEAQRDRAHAAIDSLIGPWIAALNTQRFVMKAFLAVACPWLTNHKAAVARYGLYIKHKLVEYRDTLPVRKFVKFVDAIRAALAKRLGRKAPPKTFDTIKGFVRRISSFRDNTRSMRTPGCTWMHNIAVWGVMVFDITHDAI